MMFADLLHVAALHRAELGLFFIVALFIAFALEKFPPVVIAITGAAIMILFGWVATDRAIAAFANPAPITIAAFFVLSGALIRTGTIEAIAGAIVRQAELHPRRTLAELLLGAATAPAFVNNTPVVMVLIPLVKRLAKTVGVAATRLLIPISYLSILSGTLTLVGTSTNLLVDGVARDSGLRPFGIFEITQVGIVALLSGAATLAILGPLLLPRRRDIPMQETDQFSYLTELAMTPEKLETRPTIADLKELTREKVELIALRRGDTLIRSPDGAIQLGPDDRLVVRAAAGEIDDLARSHDYTVGLQGLGQPIRLASDERSDKVKLVGLMVSPAHIALGRRLSELPMLANLRVRVLGLGRAGKASAGALGRIRVRPADSLLVAADDDAIIELSENTGFIAADTSRVRRYRRHRAPIALMTLAGVIALAAFGVASITTLAIIGVALVLATRCIDPDEAWQSIDGNVLMLIVAMLVIGEGLQSIGTVQLIVSALSPVLAHASPLLLIILLYALTSLLTETVTNNAVAVIMTPVAIGIAQSAGLDPRALVVTVMFAASASFATPIGYQTNTMVYAAADYRFTDFVKIGIPMNVIVGIATCLAVFWLF
jgi:di/tricarboxylate transporter